VEERGELKERMKDGGSGIREDSGGTWRWKQWPRKALTKGNGDIYRERA